MEEEWDTETAALGTTHMEGTVGTIRTEGSEDTILSEGTMDIIASAPMEVDTTPTATPIGRGAAASRGAAPSLDLPAPQL